MLRKTTGAVKLIAEKTGDSDSSSNCSEELKEPMPTKVVSEVITASSVTITQTKKETKLEKKTSGKLILLQLSSYLQLNQKPTLQELLYWVSLTSHFAFIFCFTFQYH